MTFEEFSAWCNQRACDGMWGPGEAVICSVICSTIHRSAHGLFARKKKEKVWQECSDRETAERIVAETNKIIAENIGGK